MWKRKQQCWTFGNPFALRFLDDPPADPPADPPTDPPGDYQGAEWYKDRGFNEEQLGVLKEYRTESDVTTAYVDLKKSYSTGFRMPEKLTDGQKKEISIRMAKENGVPVGMEGADALAQYPLSDPPDELKVPGMKISEEGKARFQQFCFDKGIAPNLANELYQMYKSEMRETHASGQSLLKDRQETTFSRLSELHGGKDAVKEGMEYIMQYCKEFSDSPDDWQDFQNMMMQNGRGDSHILMRALWGPAHTAMAEATSPQAAQARAAQSTFKTDLALAQQKWPNQKYLHPKPTDDKYRRA